MLGKNILKYKVVTQNLKSLGLRKNPNILSYKINKWKCLPKNKIKSGNSDWGGIWVAQTLSNARKLKDYMKNKYNQQTRIFVTLIGSIIYENSYRCKTDRIKLIKEIV